VLICWEENYTREDWMWMGHERCSSND